MCCWWDEGTPRSAWYLPPLELPFNDAWLCDLAFRRSRRVLRMLTMPRTA